MRLFFIYYVFIILIFFSCKKENKETIYRLVAPSKSHISFSNTITIADSLVLPGYEYIYNGGGVGIGDINNDGLQDIYFAGNQTSSRLYLNKGEMTFEDITDRAGVGTHTWANGVCIVDINQDGYMDIYVSVGGHQFTPENERANLLFINNKNGTFIESAKAYGLDDHGYGIQAAFFDYDRDGDLDMYLLRNSFVNYARNTAKPKSVNGEAPSTDKLFRNNGNNTFTDVSKEAHITIEGFGLGINIADFNKDGWPDVYVSNDFITNDLMWINQRDGTFKNEIANYLKHQTFNGMGNDVADYNNDGLPDIVVLDMLPPDNKRWKLTPRGNSYDEFNNGLSKGYEPQYVRNTLQLNNGNGTYSEIGQLAGVSATDWSWSSLFIDLDQDGWKDLYITNGYGKDITNLDFIVYGDQSSSMGLNAATIKERIKLLNELPGISVHNYVYKNNHDLTFTDVTQDWTGLQPTFSNGAAYADLDNDGDLELITNNIDEPASIWQSMVSDKKDENHNYANIILKGSEKNQSGLGSSIILTHQGQKQFQYVNPYKGYLSTMQNIHHFGLGKLRKIDSIEIIWPDGKYELLSNVNANTSITADYKNATRMAEKNAGMTSTLFSDITDSIGIYFNHQENIFTDFKVQPLLPWMHSKTGPGIAVGDVNGDGLEDFFICNATGHTGKLFVQSSGLRFKEKNIQGLDSLSDEVSAYLIDLDGDKDLDLYIVKGGSEQRLASTYYQDVVWINDGNGNFTLDKNALPVINQSGSRIAFCDYDQDGDIDIFRGSRVLPSSYPISPKSYFLINDTKNGFPVFKISNENLFDHIGMVTDAVWSDYNRDGWQDLMIVGEFMPITFIQNDHGKLSNQSDKTNLSKTNGWWNAIAAADFDEDGDDDYVLGNLGLNTRFTCSDKEPITIYAKDYNQDGTIDPVMACFIAGKQYANHTRDQMISQMTAMRSRFKTYTHYSNASFDETLSPEETADAYTVNAYLFSSMYMENKGNSQFTLKKLPIQAQFSTINDFQIMDYNRDHHLDVLAVGNNYTLEVITGRSDAGTGLILQGDGKGNFVSVPITETGFHADRDARSIKMLKSNNAKPIILVGNNNSRMQLFKLK